MQVYEILHTEIEPLRVADPAEEALLLMGKHNVNLLPVVDYTTRKLLGMLSEAVALANPDQLCGSLLDQTNEVVALDPDYHVFDAEKVMDASSVDLLPVVDNSKNYLGVITRKALRMAIASMLNLHENGTVLTIELGIRDLSLTEIVRLTEQEGAKILGITVEPPDQMHDNFRVSMKLNLIDSSRVTAALNRYGYVITSESEKPLSDEDFNYRADEFLRYLNT